MKTYEELMAEIADEVKVIRDKREHKAVKGAHGRSPLCCPIWSGLQPEPQP